MGLHSSLLLKVIACYSAFCKWSKSCAISFCNKSHSFSFAGAVSALNAVMEHPKALELEYVMAHDTAVSALGKILEFHREKLKAEKVYVLFSLYFLLDLPFGLIFDWRVC